MIVKLHVDFVANTLIEADAFRMKQFRTLQEAVALLKYHTNAIHQTACTVLWPLLNRAALDLSRLGYHEQTLQFDLLIRQLEHSNNREFLHIVDLLELLQNLKRAQVQFQSWHRKHVYLQKCLLSKASGPCNNELFPTPSYDITEDNEHTKPAEKLQIGTPDNKAVPEHSNFAAFVPLPVNWY